MGLVRCLDLVRWLNVGSAGWGRGSARMAECSFGASIIFFGRLPSEGRSAAMPAMHQPRTPPAICVGSLCQPQHVGALCFVKIPLSGSLGSSAAEEQRTTHYRSKHRGCFHRRQLTVGSDGGHRHGYSQWTRPSIFSFACRS